MASVYTKAQALAEIAARRSELDRLLRLAESLTPRTVICLTCGLLYRRSARDKCWCDFNSDGGRD